MKKEQNLDEVRNDVIDHLRQLIKDINFMDDEKVEQIAMSLGVIEQPLNHIEISNKFYVDDISHFFPEGTPNHILIEALRNVEEYLQERSIYDMQETLLCCKEELCKALVDDIVDYLEKKFNYSFIEKIAVNNEEFMFIISAVDSNKEAVTLLVKHHEGATYELLKIIEDEDFSHKEWEQKLLDSSIKNEKLELLETFELKKE